MSEAAVIELITMLEAQPQSPTDEDWYERALCPQTDPDAALQMMPAGTIANLISAGRRAPRGADIVLRKAASETLAIHGQPVASEALLPIDLGPDRHPALLLIGSAEPGRFSPAQGTDLLRFFGQVFRLVLMGWLRE